MKLEIFFFYLITLSIKTVFGTVISLLSVATLVVTEPTETIFPFIPCTVTSLPTGNATDDDAIETMYGKEKTADKIIRQTSKSAPNSIEVFPNTLRKYAK